MKEKSDLRILFAVIIGFIIIVGPILYSLKGHLSTLRRFCEQDHKSLKISCSEYSRDLNKATEIAFILNELVNSQSAGDFSKGVPSGPYIVISSNESTSTFVLVKSSVMPGIFNLGEFDPIKKQFKYSLREFRSDLLHAWFQKNGFGACS